MLHLLLLSLSQPQCRVWSLPRDVAVRDDDLCCRPMDLELATTTTSPNNNNSNFVCIDVDTDPVMYKCSNNYRTRSNNQQQRGSALSPDLADTTVACERRLKYAQNSPKHRFKDIAEETVPLHSKSSSKGSIQFEPQQQDQQRSSDCSGQLLELKQRNSDHFIPRKSLLGKPLMARNYSRQDAQYRKLQSKIYNFLERPKNWEAIGYHILVFASVFTCLVLSVLSTIEGISDSAGECLFYVELSVLFWFFTEYCMRMWSAGCRSRYQTWRGRILFAKQPFCLVDLIVILASIVVLALGSDRQMFAASALRGLRFFQILRMIRMDRRGGSWKLLASVVWAHRQELFTTIYIGFLVLVFSSFLIYLAEKDEKDKIQSYADALWWGVITLCTVGYGDTVPKTPLGKLIAGCCAIAGISFFALPAGILGSGFALKVQQHQRHKHLIRRRMPAATLIQSLWRCYSSDPQSTSVATWRPHLKCFRPSTVDKSSVTVTDGSSLFSGLGAVDRLAKLSRLSTIKRRCERLTSSTTAPPSSAANPCSWSSSNLAAGTTPLSSSLPEDPDDGEESLVPLEGSPSTEEGPFYPVSRRNALAQANGDKAREEEKKKFGILDDFFLNRYTSVASMTRDETEEWDNAANKRELSQKEKNAIRFIRKIKFFVAARKFKEALRPYDLKDIIEQYSSGHVDMLARIKGLQARLDNLFGRTDVKETPDFDPRVSLASRIVKIESKVDTIELKLDRLLQEWRNNPRGGQQQQQQQHATQQQKQDPPPPRQLPTPSTRPITVGFCDDPDRLLFYEPSSPSPPLSTNTPDFNHHTMNRNSERKFDEV